MPVFIAVAVDCEGDIMKIAICDDSEKDRNILMKLIKKVIDSENLDVDRYIIVYKRGRAGKLLYH